jgi:LysR family transcriptional regulator for bpeEF and oprC
MDKLWAMEVFVRVMECGSFSRAAESLNLANATITSSLRNLETHLGVVLIQRNTRHLRLTEEGEIFLPKCKEILKSVAQIESEVNVHATEISGMLRVESPFAIGQNILCPKLPELHRRYPNLSIAVNLTNEPHSMIERATDVAIRMGRVEDADLVARPIYEARYIICGAPSFVTELGSVSPSELDPHLCMGLLKDNYQTPNLWTLTRQSEEVVIRPQGALSFNNTAALIQAAMSKMGLIYVLDIFVADAISQGKLVQIFPEWETSVCTFHAVTVKSRFASPKIRAFIDFMLEVLDPEHRPDLKSQIAVGSDRKMRKLR